MKAAGRRRILGLDLLRGVAILLVILHHAWPDQLGSGGMVGVVAFFALSGYLITGILRRDIDRTGRVRYGHFYRNRALRLLPALVLLLGFFSVYTAIVDPLDDRSDIVSSVVVALTYTANIPLGFISPALSHLWTLATEEQFYLVWPVLLTLGLRWKRLRVVAIVAAGGILAACVGSLLITAPSTEKVYTLPTSWALAMVIGAVAKIAERPIDEMVLTRRLPIQRMAGISFVGLIALSFVPEMKGSPLTYLVGGPLVAVLTVTLILHLRTWMTLPSAALRPLHALGTISYAAYLWNWPVTLWLGVYVDGPAQALLSIGITILAASASWWLVEKPVASWKSRLDAGHRYPPDPAAA